MKVLLLNLPGEGPITRRYMCSYLSHVSLFPPLELLSCGGALRKSLSIEVVLLDAIASRFNLDACIQSIEQIQPDVILSLTGFECYEEDIRTVALIREQCPQPKFILFGHYATLFPAETLEHANADYVLLGEPDETLVRLLERIIHKQAVSDVSGIAYYENKKFIQHGQAKRIQNVEHIGSPAIDLIHSHLSYGEPLLPRPFGMIQTMRGCPYRCNYCVKSYGSKVTALSVEDIIQEIRTWVSLFNVRSIRFIDDTFTLNHHRVIALCEALQREPYRIQWTCLSRTDNLSPELIKAMKKAGCVRIYFGIEFGSQRLLDQFKKNVNVEAAIESLIDCQRIGVQTAGFFLGAFPGETEEDFQQTCSFVRKSKLNFASYNPLTPYPGTPLFDLYKDQIDFSIFPYKNVWKDPSIFLEFNRRRRIFYTRFYMNPHWFVQQLSGLLKNRSESLGYAQQMLGFLSGQKSFTLAGIQSKHEM